MEYINANGGVMGRAIELVYEDDQGAEAAATNAFQKITSEYDLAAICLNKYSSVVLAMEQFVADEGIPPSAAAAPFVWKLPRPTTSSPLVRATPAPGRHHQGNYCAELGMTKVAIIHAPDALGTGMTPVVKEVLEGHGIEVVSEQQFSADEKNFAPYIAKIVDSGCDGIIALPSSRKLP